MGSLSATSAHSCLSLSFLECFWSGALGCLEVEAWEDGGPRNDASKAHMLSSGQRQVRQQRSPGMRSEYLQPGPQLRQGSEQGGGGHPGLACSARTLCCFYCSTSRNSVCPAPPRLPHPSSPDHLRGRCQQGKLPNPSAPVAPAAPFLNSVPDKSVGTADTRSDEQPCKLQK